MTRMQAANTLIGCVWRCAVELWPYVFMAISVAGFAYIGMNVAR